jgi:hypothetical protein
MEKDNFISKPTKEKEKFKLCLVGIKKQSVNIKTFNKNKKFRLSSLSIQFPLGNT